MWPWLKNAWDQFQNSPAYFVARVRSAVMFFGFSGLAFGHDLALAAGWPGIEKPIKIMAVVCGALAVVMRAGEKNPNGNGGGS